MVAKSLAGKQSKPKQPIATTSKVDSTLTRISHLAASLPPSAPASASLNPLADLIELYTSLKLTLPESAGPKELERNRQEVHTALHTLKGVFEALINAGRLHGVLRGSKRAKSTDASEKGQSKEEEIVQKVKAWLKERWEDYLKQTAKVAGAHWDSSVRVSSSEMSRKRKTPADSVRFRRFQLSTLSCRSFAPNQSSLLPFITPNKHNSRDLPSNTSCALYCCHQTTRVF